MRQKTRLGLLQYPALPQNRWRAAAYWDLYSVFFPLTRHHHCRSPRRLDYETRSPRHHASSQGQLEQATGSGRVAVRLRSGRRQRWCVPTPTRPDTHSRPSSTSTASLNVIGQIGNQFRRQFRNSPLPDNTHIYAYTSSYEGGLR